MAPMGVSGRVSANGNISGLGSSGLFGGTGLRPATARSASPQPLVYQITETTQLHLQRGDITRFEGDAIVNAGGDACSALELTSTDEFKPASWTACPDRCIVSNSNTR